MSARRDHTQAPGPARPQREPTESLALIGDDWSNNAVEAADPTRVDPRPALPPPIRPRPAPQVTPANTERPEELVGAVLGSYRLVELIGRGGMGFVYRAEHTRLGREVALKLLRSDYARRRGAVARFFQEARTVNRIRHRNIVDVTDFVELPDGTTFIIMELLRGPHLGRWGQPPVDVARALDLVVQICDGLEAAHAVGVVHRDLKPDNVIVVDTGDGEQVKLLDFGVAKLLNRDDEDVGLETAAGSVIGTPAYMSPEQAGGLTVDARSDIYSLGAILYELFCGCPMFRGRSFGEYVRKHLTEQPTPPRQTEGGANLDERIETLILRCLEKDPARRHQHIGELRGDILGLLGALSTPSGERPRFGRVPTVYERAMTTHPPGLPVLGNRSTMPVTALTLPRRGRWIAVGALVLAGAAGLAYAVARPAPAQAVASTAPPTPPVPPAQARTVEVRIDARPPGDVFAAGASARLCTTPCSITIDPLDGGPRDRRDYLVRRAGYLDEPVAIDLSDPAHQIDVALMRARRVPAATTAPPVIDAPDGADTDTTVAAPAPLPRDTSRRVRTDRTPERSRKPRTAEAPPAKKAKPATTPPAESPPRRIGPVDPADTLDPFR